MREPSFSVSEFRPARWLPGPHFQTVGARLLRRYLRLPMFRERLELPDGDFVDLDFTFDPNSAEQADTRPLVLLVHGLEGSARSGYAIQAYEEMRRSGMAGVGLNLRSCSGEMNRLPRMYHSGDTADIEYVLRLLAERYPQRPRGAIGFSLGGNALLKLLGQLGESARELIGAAAVISVPYNLSAGADHLVRPGGWIYSVFLLRKLRRKVRAKRGIMPAHVDVARATSATTFRDFDDAATAPIHGFDDAEDYYQRSSSANSIEAIRTPTILLHSADDPFLPKGTMPVAAADANPKIVSAFTETGGHVGFIARSWPWRPVFWAEREAARFLATMMMR